MESANRRHIHRGLLHRSRVLSGGARIIRRFPRSEPRLGPFEGTFSERAELEAVRKEH